ncbi:MAG: hypothetical protein ACI96M_000395 [Candidatus Azotimanducaceae bacterium]|jgi:hypothetical protein
MHFVMRLIDIYLPVIESAQRLGLVAPCIVKDWNNWWQETRFPVNRLAEIRLSRRLLNPVTQRGVLSRYIDHGGRTTVAGLFAHELGHTFRYAWIRDRSIAPLRGYRDVFRGRARFSDPWNDMLAYLEAHPDFELDTEKYLTWYAWSDPEEDFCETFAELILSDAGFESRRDQGDVYRKLSFIRQAGRKILKATPELRSSIRRDLIYLSAGETSFACPEGGGRYGVPDRQGSYLCPCGCIVEHDGRWITHW